MIKKLFFGVIGLLFLGLVFLPEITAMMANHAMKPENVSKEWAPDLAYKAGRINMRFWRYKTAATIFEKARTTFPTAEWKEDVEYDIAVCYAESDRTKEAIAKFHAFAAIHPNHRWAGQATKRATDLEVNQ